MTVRARWFTMLTMSDKPKKKPGRPAKHPGDTDSAGRTGAPMSIRIDPDLRAIIPKYQAEFRRKNDVRLSITDVIELALRRLFRDSKMLPPDEEM
jgi:hypothetical protein